MRSGCGFRECERIVTRNVADFAGSPVPAVTPEEWLVPFHETIEPGTTPPTGGVGRGGMGPGVAGLVLARFWHLAQAPGRD
jgi:hypothetical protein